MGQRSQIYIRFNKEVGKGLIANYYQWNYGDRMISRGKWAMEFIKERLQYHRFFYDDINVTKLSRILDVNFDMVDIQISQDIIEEYFQEFSGENFNDVVFLSQDNNDGKLLIDILDSGIKYAFLNYDADLENIMDGKAYMNWNTHLDNWQNYLFLSKSEIKTCQKNINTISALGKLMTKDEVSEFLNYNYSDFF